MVTKAPIKEPETQLQVENQKPIIESYLACTDMGNGERLIQKYGSILRYSYQASKWFHWLGTHWQQDNSGHIEYLSKETMKSIHGEAEVADDKERRIELSKWAITCENGYHLELMAKRAQSEFGIPIQESELDRDLMLFNCLNGTINLETGKLQEHNASDLITTCVPINYDKNDKCPLWLDFLGFVTAGDKDLQGFLQRAVGYSLTGNTKSQVIFLLYGLGENGKSTFTMTIRKLMAGYGERLNAEDLMIKDKGNGGPKEGIANLKNKRYIIGSELQDGRKLDTSLVKDMTGGETIKARRLYEHDVEFTPTFKLWLYGNHKPIITDSTISIWRRMKQIPFVVSIPKEKRDDDLQLKLEAELPGILAWAVEGCLEWQKHGLNEPSAVTTATAQYRQDQDILGDFLEDCCIIEFLANVQKTELKAEYLNWCQTNGVDPVTQKIFKARLIEKGINDGRINKTRYWTGLRLRNNDDDKSDKSDKTQNDLAIKVTGDNQLPKSILREATVEKFGVKGVTLVTPKAKRGKKEIVLSLKQPNNGKTSDILPDHPTKPCFACQGVDYWQTSDNRFLCEKCHPMPPGDKEKA